MHNTGACHHVSRHDGGARGLEAVGLHKDGSVGVGGDGEVVREEGREGEGVVEGGEDGCDLDGEEAADADVVEQHLQASRGAWRGVLAVPMKLQHTLPGSCPRAAAAGSRRCCGATVLRALCMSHSTEQTCAGRAGVSNSGGRAHIGDGFRGGRVSERLQRDIECRVVGGENGDRVMKRLLCGDRGKERLTGL